MFLNTRSLNNNNKSIFHNFQNNVRCNLVKRYPTFGRWPSKTNFKIVMTSVYTMIDIHPWLILSHLSHLKSRTAMHCTWFFLVRCCARDFIIIVFVTTINIYIFSNFQRGRIKICCPYVAVKKLLNDFRLRRISKIKFANYIATYTYVICVQLKARTWKYISLITIVVKLSISMSTLFFLYIYIYILSTGVCSKTCCLYLYFTAT